MLESVGCHSWRSEVILPSLEPLSCLPSRWFALWLGVDRHILLILWLHVHWMLCAVWTFSRKVWRTGRAQPAKATCWGEVSLIWLKFRITNSSAKLWPTALHRQELLYAPEVCGVSGQSTSVPLGGMYWLTLHNTQDNILIFNTVLNRRGIVKETNSSGGKSLGLSGKFRRPVHYRTAINIDP